MQKLRQQSTKNKPSECMAYVLLIVFILLKPQWTSENISFKGSIFWNTGYSNFITIIDSSQCQHIDPGGTLHFPKKILSLCHEKQNSHHTLQIDRFHTNYQKNLRKLNSVPNTKLMNNEKYKYFIHDSWATFGHLDLKGMAFVFLEPQTLSSTKYIVLPNHGQPQMFKPFVLHSLRKFKMRMTGSQSRSYKNHKKTETKFAKFKIPMIYKNVWGHIVLEKN